MIKTNDSFSILHPKNQLQLFGYKYYFNYFAALYQNNKLPNTILLSGPKGSGKATFVYHFVNYLLSYYEICFNVSPTVFFPKPKVYSSVFKMKIKNDFYDWKKLEKFVKNLFKNKRKIISNILNLKNIKKDPISKKRPEELTFKEVLKLYKIF